MEDLELELNDLAIEQTNYLHLFSSQTEYLSYLISSAYTEPFIGVIDNIEESAQTSYVYYNKTNKHKYFSFEILSDGNITTPANTPFSYRINDGEWISASTTTTFEVLSGDTVEFKSSNNKVNGSFSTTCDFNAYGNIMSFLNGDNFIFTSEFDGLGSGKLAYLFQNCTHLISAENLILPATSLLPQCYSYMFYGCSSLTTAPELPATTISTECYQYMFQNCSSLTKIPSILPFVSHYGGYGNICRYMFAGCTSLTYAPELPSTTLASRSYEGMFQGCTSLTQAPSILPATSIGQFCYAGMFNGCTSLEKAPDIMATTVNGGTDALRNMFYNCTSLVTGPTAIHITSLTQNCCNNMFYNCTHLTTAPEIMTTTFEGGGTNMGNMFYNCYSLTKAPSILYTNNLYYNCYNSMFYNCSSLTIAPEIRATSMANDSCCNSMFYNCKSLTTPPPMLSVSALTQQCYRNMFTNCSNLLSTPDMLALDLSKSRCCDSMFYNCTHLMSAPVLQSATTFGYGCCQNMFYDCTSLVIGPSILPGTISSTYTFANMFRGCSNLTTAPILPQATLMDYCYNSMFYGCSKLNYIKCLATDISASNSHASWVTGVQTSSGTFVKDANMTDWPTGANGIPSNWTVVDE